MSRRAADWAWATPGTGIAKYVLLALADYAHRDTNSCYPSLEEVAEKTGLSLSTTRRAVRQLETEGLIKVVVSSGGRRIRSTYTLLVSNKPNTRSERPGLRDDETQSERPGKRPTTRSERPSNKAETRSERPGLDTETRSERRENPVTVTQNPVRVTGVVPKTSHEPVSEPTTTKTALAVRGKKRQDSDGDLALIDAPVLAVQTIHGGNAVQVWVDAYRAAHPGVRETTQQKGQVSREFRQLQEAGNDSLRILQAVQSAGEKGFATISREFSLLASGRTNGNGHAARASTTENRVGVALALAETLRAEEAQAR